jgi:DNA-binding NarL/FixJ family response regulator
MNIFIVDDSAIIRDHIVAMLGRITNTQVTGQADDAPEAIADIARHPPDLVVLDIALRTSNGMDVLRYVSQQLPATKVIVLSNHSEPESRELFMNAGAYQFFDKSLEFDKIRDAITTLANPAKKPGR